MQHPIFHSPLLLLGLAGLAVAEPLPATDAVTGAAATPPRVIPITDPQVLAGLSPLNWIRGADAVHSPVCGASFNLAFVKTKRVVLNVDTSHLNYPASARFPILAWTVNNGLLQTHQLSSGETAVTLSDSVSNPVIDFYIKGLSPFEDRFHGDVPANAVTLTGFSVAPQCRVVAPPAAPVWLNIGDSILSGDAAAYATKQGRPPDDQWAASDDARASYGYLLANHYGYREPLRWQLARARQIQASLGCGLYREFPTGEGRRSASL